MEQISKKYGWRDFVLKTSRVMSDDIPYDKSIFDEAVGKLNVLLELLLGKCKSTASTTKKGFLRIIDGILKI